MAVNDAT